MYVYIVYTPTHHTQMNIYIYTSDNNYLVSRSLCSEFKMKLWRQVLHKEMTIMASA